MRRVNTMPKPSSKDPMISFTMIKRSVDFEKLSVYLIFQNWVNIFQSIEQYFQRQTFRADVNLDFEFQIYLHFCFKWLRQMSSSIIISMWYLLKNYN